MKKFALTLVLLTVWSWPMEFGTGTESQDLNAGKSAAAPKSPEEQKKTGKDAAVQPQGKKKGAKKDEDCGCETTLFGEPVPQPVKKSAQGKANTNAGKQTAKSKGKNVDNSKAATKSDLKEGALQNSEKQPGSSGNAGQSNNLTAQPSDK